MGGGGGGESWNTAAKLCDSCKSAAATLFCRADSAFLCLGCDSKIHAANKLASRHARVWMCEVCEQAPASVTCKADAAALCAACDRDIHTANPLASRHERFPVTPFYDSPDAANKAKAEERYVSDFDGGEAEEAEAASWLLLNPNPNPKGVDSPDLKNNGEYIFSDMDPYVDLDLMAGDQKPHQLHHHQQAATAAADGVVPVQPPSVVDGLPCYDVDYGSKPFMYNFSTQSISQSVSSSSMEVGVVPDHNALTDVSTAAATTYGVPANPAPAIDREARVMRYREKRKNRKFEKTIRYASRKAYAETRPRIKGRFAKRSEVDVSSSPTFSVVPSF